MEIPEFVYGIPTKKSQSKERVGLIRDYYAQLWKKLQKEGRNNSVFNNFLGVNVFIVEKESDKKTIYAASKNWQSTYAVKQKTALYITSRLNNRNVYGLEQMPNSS